MSYYKTSYASYFCLIMKISVNYDNMLYCKVSCLIVKGHKSSGLILRSVCVGDDQHSIGCARCIKNRGGLFNPSTPKKYFILLIIKPLHLL